jgi:sugar lactone lactonase YvrE
MLKFLRSRFLSIVTSAIFALAVLLPLRAWGIPAPISVLLQINRVAGSPTGVAGNSGDAGPALSALLSQPESVAIDGGGNLYIADTSNNQVRRIDAATGIITTVAGNGQQGYNGDGIAATQASLYQPSGVVVDGHGNLYIADTGNRIVRFVNLQTGIITTVAGTPNLTTFDPTNIGDNGPATHASIDIPAAIALDSAGNLYIADSGNNRIRKVTAATGIITTAAGNGTAGFSGDGGLATAATLNQPTGIAVDLAGNLDIADSGNNLIRQVSAATGNIATVAGVPGAPGFNNDGVATATKLNFPTGIAVDLSGQIYFSDRGNNRIRTINSSGNIVTLTGNGTAALLGDGGLASAAEVNAPGGLAVDAAGEIYIADSGNNDLRLLSTGLSWPVAEIATPNPVTHTIFLETNLGESLTAPQIAIAEDNKIEFKVGTVTGTGCTMDGTTIIPVNTVCNVAVSFTPAYPGERTSALQFTANGTLPVSLGVYGIGLGPQTTLIPGIIHTILPPGSAVTGGLPLTNPGGIAVDSASNLYIADPGTNQVVRQDISGGITVIAGGGSLPPASADGGPATDAKLNKPEAVALDAAGNLYIAETGANRIRKVNLATGIITTVAGNGTAGYLDNINALNAELNAPGGIAASPTGELWIADTGNNVIRRLHAQTGAIFTIAGTTVAGYTGDNGYASAATLHAPEGIAVDAVGDVFIADTGNNAVRKINPVTGVITTVAGNGTAGFSGDDGLATTASLNVPAGVAVDPAGNLYIADSSNARIRKVDAATGLIHTIAGSAQTGNSGDGGPATKATLSQPAGVSMDSDGEIYISDASAAAVRVVSTGNPSALVGPGDSGAPVLNFGSETVGGTTPPQTVVLSNIGNQTLAISKFSVPLDFPANAHPAQCAVGNLLTGATCDLSFVFHPTVAGPITENAVLADNALNAAGSQQAVTLTGNGVAQLIVPTTTTVSVNPSTAVYGTPVTLTATVSTGTGPVPSGSVLFFINGIQVAGATLNGSGVATVTLLAAPTGTDVVTATFSQQGNYGASTSAQATLIVTPAGTQTTLTAVPQQIRLGQNVILTATVASGTTGIPTGTVNFMNGSAQIGQATVNAGGVAILNTTTLPAGTDTITAVYLGDGNFQTSTSNAVTVTVADDTLTMTVNPNQLNIPGGKTAQVAVTLTPQNGFAGTVNLSCAGLIAGATCQFSAPTATFVAQTQTPQTIQLVINPNTPAVAGLGAPFSGSGSLLVRLMLLLLTLSAAGLLLRARKRGWALGLGRALLVLFCLGLCTLSGCKAVVPAMPTADTITVQATMPSSGVVASAQIQTYMAQ